MRGARAFVVLTAMLLMLGIVSYALYRIALVTSVYSQSPLSPQIGQMLFSALAFLELMMVCFITPAVTAGAISSEREMLTYEMLMATPLRPASILWGKLVSALSYVFLLILAAIPMASLVFIFGGITSLDMIKSLVVLISIAVTLGVVGVFLSAWLGRTARATVVSYLVVLALLVGPVFVYVLVGVLRQAEPPRWILVPNPVSALFSAITPAAPGNGVTSVFWGLGMALGGNLSALTGSLGQASLPRPLFHYTLVLYGALTLALYFLATRLVQPTHRWRVSRKDMLVALALFLTFGFAVALAFVATASQYAQVGIFSMATPTPAMAVPAVEVQEVVIVAPAAAPVPAPSAMVSPLPTPARVLTVDDQAAIYAAVVRQIYTADHTFGDQPPNFPIVYLVRTTDDSVGDPGAPQTGPSTLAEAVQTGIEAALDDLPAEIEWIDKASEVPLDDNRGTVAGGGAVITLGNLHLQENGSVLVSARLYFSMPGAMGKTYVLDRVDGNWQVIGDTGVQWMS